MNIIISHVYSNDNKGDAALLSVLLGDVRKTFSDSQVTILTIDEIKKGEKFEGTPMENAFMYHALDRYQNRPSKLLYSFFVMGSTLSWALLYRLTGRNMPLPAHLEHLTALYKKADLIIPVGGGYLRGKPGLVSTVEMLLLLHPMLLSRIIDKPTMIYAASVGPFGNRLQMRLMKSVLKRVECIMIREDKSLRLLKSMGIMKNVVRSIDSGFMFKSQTKKDLRKELGIPAEKLLVGVTARKWLERSSQLAYEMEMAKFIDLIIEKYDAEVVFIPQVTSEHHSDDDRITSQDIYGFVNNKKNAHVLLERYDHNAIKAAYDTLDFMVGTRFHSVIFSLTGYVPAIAIEYEHKTSGIMRDLGLDGWVIRMEEVTAEKLHELFARLVAKQDSYRKQLADVLPSYILRAEELPAIMKQVVESDSCNGKKV